MKYFFTFSFFLFLCLNCFSQKTDSVKIIEDKMKGFWRSTDLASSKIDSLYFGDNGNFYAAQYHSSDASKGYAHHVGRWWITVSVYGGYYLEVSCASMEQEKNFVKYEVKLKFNKPFFFMGEEWRKTLK